MDFKMILDWKTFLAIGIASSLIVVAAKVKREESGKVLEQMFNKVDIKSLTEESSRKYIKG